MSYRTGPNAERPGSSKSNACSEYGANFTGCDATSVTFPLTRSEAVTVSVPENSSIGAPAGQPNTSNSFIEELVGLICTFCRNLGSSLSMLMVSSRTVSGAKALRQCR